MESSHWQKCRGVIVYADLCTCFRELHFGHILWLVSWNPSMYARTQRRSNNSRPTRTKATHDDFFFNCEPWQEETNFSGRPPLKRQMKQGRVKCVCVLVGLRRRGLILWRSSGRKWSKWARSQTTSAQRTSPMREKVTDRWTALTHTLPAWCVRRKVDSHTGYKYVYTRAQQHQENRFLLCMRAAAA